MKIMIRATNWVGDAISGLLPALRAVRQRIPDAKISIVARPTSPIFIAINKSR
jgi:ADP-heptose:LPS heptosyltransferase